MNKYFVIVIVIVLIFSVICIQESWLSEVDDISQIQLEGCKCITQVKSCSAKGGLIIYLLDQFEHIPMLKLNKCNTWDGQGIQVKKDLVLAKHINIVNIYIPPKDDLEHYKEFIDEFSYILDKLYKNKK